MNFGLYKLPLTSGHSESNQSQRQPSVLTQKFAKEFDGLPAVMPAKTGIQKH
jgi:hypothetical protein